MREEKQSPEKVALVTEPQRDEPAADEREERYRAMFEKNPIVKLLVDPQSGAICEANFAAAEFYGYSREQLRQMTIADLNFVLSDAGIVETAQAANEEHDLLSFQHQLASGQVRSMEVYASPLHVKARHYLYILIHDVTERKLVEEQLRKTKAEAEQRVAERTAELQWTIRELQQLARLAAHDLQEPVRLIHAYTQLFARHYKDKVDEGADELIHTIEDATKRLQRLLLDLLAYSEVSAHRLVCTTVDCEELLAGALADLRGTIAECGAVVTADALPVVWGDRSQLQILFRNLIHNGMKFHNGDPPSVHIAATTDDSWWTFSIRDNGIGIPPEDVQRIFLIFQRLHTQDPYPKPGVGLAICKKIIDRHGGQIWVDPSPGHGATFWFTLPVVKSGK